MVTPVVMYGDDTVRGQTLEAHYDLAPVKQDVYVVFQQSYVDSLRHGIRRMGGVSLSQ